MTRPTRLRPAHGNYPDLFQRLLADQGFTFQTWRVLDMDFPASPHDADGWLITGSRFGAYEDHAFIPPLEEFIRAVHAAGVPMVGICFGHQIIAQAMGGRVVKHPRRLVCWPHRVRFRGPHRGAQRVASGPGGRTSAGATVCASNDFCENAALLYGDRIFTVQAHPEFHHDFTADIIEKRGRGLVPDPLLDAATARLGQPVDDTTLARAIGDFFRTRHLGVLPQPESLTA